MGKLPSGIWGCFDEGPPELIYLDAGIRDPVLAVEVVAHEVRHAAHLKDPVWRHATREQREEDALEHGKRAAYEAGRSWGSSFAALSPVEAPQVPSSGAAEYHGLIAQANELCAWRRTMPDGPVGQRAERFLSGPAPLGNARERS